MLKAELNWLPRSIFKGVKYPEISFEEPNNQNYSGYFLHHTNKLVIVYNEFEYSTIAHEVRHYIQSQYSELTASKFEIRDSYEKTIYNYFTTNPFEFDALLFEYKYAKSIFNEWWLRKLVLECLCPCS